MDWIERLNRDVTGQVPLLIGSELCPVEVLHWAYSAALPDNVAHRHTFFEVCLVGRYGTGTFLAMNREYPLTPGDLFVARPGVLHRIRNTGDHLMELCWVSFAATPTATKIATFLQPFAESGDVVIPERAHALTPLWNGALPSIAGNGESSSASVAAVASALITGITQSGVGGNAAYASSTAPSPLTSAERLARIAVRYIHDNLNRPISVAEIASQVHVSPRHLTRIIESFVGVAPAAYIERARIDRAATLLARSLIPIKEIADAVGYGTVHQFTRAFTRVQGRPPGMFRREGGDPIRRDADTEQEGALV
ncbi:MAG: helix-turn-helix transcriptional regulator [Akkermansiaceae bacterium]|nr:helix-turn-helix transcriptional regulator [Armatimonadota bacterium]